MAFLGILSAVIIICGLLVFFFLNHAVEKETKEKNIEFSTLMKFGKSTKSFEQFAEYAAKTRFSQVVFYQIGSPEPFVFKGHPKQLSGNQMKMPYDISAQDKDSIKNILSEVKKGSATFSDPQDSPLMYSRPFLRVEFDDDIITKVTEGNLG